jgi:hypothetical protein
MNPHLAPWNIAADDFPADTFASDQLEFLIGYAILAPSSHNSQPWLFRINAMDVELFADRRRALPVVDPQQRELTISCGAALFNLRVAAEYFGHSYRLEILPDPEDQDLLARFHLGLAGETRSEDILMFNALTQRRTNRQPFMTDPLPSELLESLMAAAREEGAWLQIVDGEDNRRAVADLVAEADRIQWADRHFRGELARWVRTRPDETRDGLLVQDMGVKDWLAFLGPALIRTFDRGGGQAAKDQDIALHSPVLAVLGTNADDVAAWLAAGQALQSVLLRARAEGVWASYLNQPIEVESLRPRLAATVAVEGSPQILLRLGYGTDIQPTPRRTVHEVVLKHESRHA